MPETKKYLDLESLKSYHDKFMEKKMTWENLKKRPFETTTTDTLLKTTLEYDYTDLDYNSFGFKNYDENTEFTIRLEGTKYESLHAIFDSENNQYIVYQLPDTEFLDTPNPIYDSIFALVWNKVEKSAYFKASDYYYKSLEIIVKGLNKKVVSKIDEKYIPSIDYGTLKNAPDLSISLELLNFSTIVDSGSLEEVIINSGTFEYESIDTEYDDICLNFNSYDEDVVKQLSIFPNEITVTMSDGDSITLRKVGEGTEYHEAYYGNSDYYHWSGTEFTDNQSDAPLGIDLYSDSGDGCAWLTVFTSSDCLNQNLTMGVATSGYLSTESINASIENSKKEIEDKYFNTEIDKYVYPYIDFVLMEPTLPESYNKSDYLVEFYNTLEESIPEGR